MGARYYHAIAHVGPCAAMRNAQNNADRRGKVAAYNIETLVLQLAFIIGLYRIQSKRMMQRKRHRLRTVSQ